MRIRIRLHTLIAVTWLPALVVGPAVAQESVVDSVHNLSTSGRGRITAQEESRVCIFCHTPHNASPQAPLWNRFNPRTHYRIYSSSTTDARIDQPGGPSKMCLSCHDGSIALGMVLSRDPTNPIRMNQDFLPTGTTNLTNDLSDDHPIGFRFDRQLFNRDRQLRSPDVISREIKLGDRGELECVACHDPHNNEWGDFLRITERQGALCRTCHQMDGWRIGSHALSSKTVPVRVTNGIKLPFRSLADNACASCHVAHNAVERERLLRSRSFDLCISCHDGITGRDIHPVLNLRSGHRVNRFIDIHDPAEDPRTMQAHIDCVDCHNPHAVRGNPAATVGPFSQGVFLPPAMEHVQGVSLAGSFREQARQYHEVCFRCHGDNPVRLSQRIIRQRDVGGNIRRQVLPTAASSHPIATFSGRSNEVPSLLPSTRGQLALGCQACHNNPDARQLGGSGPNGPHGSRFDFLLAARYETADFTVESAQSYALCYRCHDRASILGDQSFTFHRVHIADSRAPCSACHAAHGVTGSRSRHSHLINFDVSIVGGQRTFVDTGRFSGSCTLTCHGVNHVNFSYATP